MVNPEYEIEARVTEKVSTDTESSGDSHTVAMIRGTGIESWPADRKAKLALYLKEQGF